MQSYETMQNGGNERKGLSGIFALHVLCDAIAVTPTLSLYLTSQRVYGVVVSPGTKGLRLDALAVVRRTDSLEQSLASLHQQLEGTTWGTVAVALESNSLALATFPIEQNHHEMILREQLELEIVQQFLSTPSEGYLADIFRLGPDAEGRYNGLALCRLRQQQEVQIAAAAVLGEPVHLTASILAAAAAYAYNYPERKTKRVGIVLLGEGTIELLAVEGSSILFFGWSPVQGSFEAVLQRMVRSALLHCGDLTTLYFTGVGLSRKQFEQVVTTFEGRFAEPVFLLDAFRLVECGMPTQLCQTAAPLGHLFAPALGAALQPLYFPPSWTFASALEPERS